MAPIVSVDYCKRQSGLAYLAVLFIVVGLAVSMLIVSQNEQTLSMREKERDWVFVGQQYQKAINQYYAQSPNGIKELPKSIDDLVRDQRFLKVTRHLRRAYKDPLTGQDWLELRNEAGLLVGVRSASAQPIFLRSALGALVSDLQNIQFHQDLKFEFKPTSEAQSGSDDGEQEESEAEVSQE